MTTVIKRDGREEPFNETKLRLSVSITSDAIGQPVSERELDYITGTVCMIVGGRERITTYQLYIILIGVLYSEGYISVAEAYNRHVTNAWQK